MDLGMNGPLDDGMVGWIGRRVGECKKNTYKLPDMVNKTMLDGQFGELDRSDETDIQQVRHII
jgi:hypothetical protein